MDPIKAQEDEESWLLTYGALLVFGVDNGHYNVPRETPFVCMVMLAGISEPQQYAGKLGIWLDNQRQAWRRNPTRTPLTSDQRGLLQELVKTGTSR